MIIKADGTLRYHGKQHVERKGKHTGQIEQWQFNALAMFIKEAGYMELKPYYTALVTDMPTAYTMVVSGGQRKTVSNYGAVGPAKLWAIEQLIDKLVLEAKWDKGTGNRDTNPPRRRRLRDRRDTP